MHTEVVVLFFIVGTLATIILVHLMNTHKTRIKTHELLEKSIEKGFDVTPELLDKLNNVKSPRFKDFRRGIIMCAIGAAVFCFSLVIPQDDGAVFFRGISLFPFFIGVGFLLVWKVNKYEN